MENFIKSALSILSTIGTIGQKLLGGGSNNVMTFNDGATIIKGNFLINGDVEFYLRLINEQLQLYVYNKSSTQEYLVTLSGEGTSKGDAINLKPHEEHPITDWMSLNNTPDREILVSPVVNSVALAHSGIDSSGNANLKLSFNRLAMNGSPVTLGGFTIKAVYNKDYKGLLVTCKNRLELKNMELCTLTSDKNVSVTIGDPISPESDSNMNDTTTYYPIDYALHGLADAENFRGLVGISVPPSNHLEFLSQYKQSKTVPATYRNFLDQD